MHGHLARTNTFLVVDVGSQKNAGKGKVTAVIDHYFHVTKEAVVQGETILEVTL